MLSLVLTTDSVSSSLALLLLGAFLDLDFWAEILSSSRNLTLLEMLSLLKIFTREPARTFTRELARKNERTSPQKR